MNAPPAILITGANRGIGLGLTREFLRLNWKVFAACRQPAVATGLIALKLEHAGGLEVVSLDVTDEGSAAALAQAIARQTPALDVLVNNAGINPGSRDHTVADVAVEAVATAVDVNVLGALRVIQAVLPLLKRSPAARIVNVSSGAGSLAHNSSARSLPAYCISKAALNMLTRRAARDLAAFGITTVSVSPGWIRTDMGGPEAELSVEEATAALATMIGALQPQHNGQWLDRFGRPSEFAW